MCPLTKGILIYLLMGLLVENFFWHSLDRQQFGDYIIGLFIVLFWPLYIVLRCTVLK